MSHPDATVAVSLLSAASSSKYFSHSKRASVPRGLQITAQYDGPSLTSVAQSVQGHSAVHSSETGGITALDRGAVFLEEHDPNLRTVKPTGSLLHRYLRNAMLSSAGV
ncbi:hypothetical protein CSKR_202092 [Clonorchis sinensis]|uniref:Uncharacterized protein n=1 Tax=Clonorchis sinensis TaxID=79923 RepID=A0A8T1LXF4_CLOSI|nr:hypothetical protein CSKR_202092 [Clonorchis sinensis]